MIDTHAHLDALDDPGEVVARAREAGVGRILTVGTDVAGCRRALELADAHDGVFAILGIHPHAANDATEADVAEVRSLLAHPKAVGAGEMGLDWFRYYAPREAQQRLFARMLAVAQATGKPAVIHTRAADADTLAALERGWYVSFAGNATFPKAVDLRLAATKVPAGRILAETDAPYLAPQAVRGKRNEPAHVMHTLAALAQARGEDPHELERQIDLNATECFSLPG